MVTNCPADSLYYYNYCHYLWQLLLSFIDCLLCIWHQAKGFPSIVFFNSQNKSIRYHYSQLVSDEKEMRKNWFAHSHTQATVGSQGLLPRVPRSKPVFSVCRLCLICEVSQEWPPFPVACQDGWSIVESHDGGRGDMFSNVIIHQTSCLLILKSWGHRGECEEGSCPLQTEGHSGLVSAFESSPLQGSWCVICVHYVDEFQRKKNIPGDYHTKWSKSEEKDKYHMRKLKKKKKELIYKTETDSQI